MKFSICVSTDEMRGRGAIYLEKLFQSLKDQTYANFEVIVRDRSRDTAIEKICENWRNYFSIILRRYPEHGAAQAIAGDIVKPMRQDDYMRDKDCLRQIRDAFQRNPKANWGISGYIHTDEYGKKMYDAVIPKNHGDIPMSAIFHKRGKTAKKGQPIIIKENLIVIRRWPFQSSNYIIARQFKIKDRIRLELIRARRIAQSIKHMIQKKIKTCSNSPM